MGLDIKTECNFCKKKIEEGLTYLQLFGRYEHLVPILAKRDYTDKIKIEDNIRPFWVICKGCLGKIQNQIHDKNYIIKFNIEDIRDSTSS